MIRFEYYIGHFFKALEFSLISFHYFNTEVSSQGKTKITTKNW